MRRPISILRADPREPVPRLATCRILRDDSARYFGPFPSAAVVRAVLDFTENFLSLEPIDKKWEAFGWNVIRVEGQSVPELLKALHGLRSRRRPNPTIVIADTTKGAGIDSMSCIPLWHGAAPTGDAATLAVAELERNSPHA